MIRILRANSAPTRLLTELSEWFESEWGEVDSFAGNHAEIDIPSPLVAVDGQTSLLGGLSFTTAPKPHSLDIGIWINMVLVSPTQRKQGIASRLVQSAEEEAKHIGVQELFVLSEFPGLYQNLGWQFVAMDSSEKETILNKTL